jgi:hypothetical protein
MSPISQAKLLLFLIALLVVQAVLLFWNGLLMINLHEGDAMHLMQILLRMEQGQIPHKDFMTPIGILAFAPIMVFMGMGVGKAYLAGNVLMAALAIPAIWWVAKSRLSTGLAYGLGAGIIILMTAMVHGDILQVSSVSMYYNRWAWAISFLVVLTAVLPPKIDKHQWVDGIVLGLGISALALIKATYFITFLPPLLLVVLLRGYWKTAFVAFGTGLGVIVAVSLMTGGVDFWWAYIGDLQLVRNSGVRSFPSQPLSYLLIGPKFLLVNIVVLLAVVFLRQAGRQIEGLALLLLMPGFVYITYQNWGNDPQYLFVLGLMLLALRPERPITNSLGWDMRTSLGVLAALSLAMIAPSALNIAASTVRYAQLEPSDFAVVLPEPRHSNLVFKTDLLYAAERRQYTTIPDEKMAALGEKFSDRRSYVLYGEPLEYCKLRRGLGGFQQFYAKDLKQVAETAGKSVFVADLLSNLWMFGPTVPIEGGSPWYYGGDAGLSRADYLLVPFCPSTPQVWGMVFDRLKEEGAPKFTEIRRTDTYILLRRLKL